jgi:hypothetical protein
VFALFQFINKEVFFVAATHCNPFGFVWCVCLNNKILKRHIWNISRDKSYLIHKSTMLIICSIFHFFPLRNDVFCCWWILMLFALYWRINSLQLFNIHAFKCGFFSSIIYLNFITKKKTIAVSYCSFRFSWGSVVFYHFSFQF